jgi:hypothetical protein
MKKESREESVKNQVTKIESVFPGRFDVQLSSLAIELSERRTPVDFLSYHIHNLIIIPPHIISTKEFFEATDLGRKEANTWFLDEKKMYDIIKVPEVPYFIVNLNISNVFASDDKGRHLMGPNQDIKFLTLHEVAVLLFQYPELLSGNIQGAQALASRYQQSSERGYHDDDATLELYKKGIVGSAFLKLAREQHHYWDHTRIIPLGSYRHEIGGL